MELKPDSHGYPAYDEHKPLLLRRQCALHMHVQGTAYAAALQREAAGAEQLHPPLTSM